MIDIHTHVLPGIDDGSKNVEMTMQMLDEAYTAGFTDIITTSHYIENEYDIPKKTRQEIINALQEQLNEEGININLYNGAEAFITNNLASLVDEGKIPTLANSHYVLFEIPMTSKVLYLNQVLEDLITSGYRPIIAHPERYSIVQENPNIAIEWVKSGALLQSNYASMVDRYGHKAKKTLIKLLNANAIHFLGSDTHRPKNNYKQMDEILEEWKKVIDKKTLKLLSTKNPEKILDDERIIVEEPNEIKKHWFL